MRKSSRALIFRVAGRAAFCRLMTRMIISREMQKLLHFSFCLAAAAAAWAAPVSKKPAVNIDQHHDPAYQLRRYAWNAHLPLSILTDFEEFAVYNCKARPDPANSAATGRDLFYRYTDYIEKWDEIAAIFSRDAVWKGALDRYAETSKGKKGTTEVDDEFLKDMNEWRVKLARVIARITMQGALRPLALHRLLPCHRALSACLHLPPECEYLLVAHSKNEFLERVHLVLAYSVAL